MYLCRTALAVVGVMGVMISAASAQEIRKLPPPVFGARAAGMHYEWCAPRDPAPVPSVAALSQRVRANLRMAMAQAERGMVVRQGQTEAGLMRTLMRDLPAGTMPSVVMTSFSDGAHECTRRIDYAGGGAAPVVRSTGNGCGG